MPNRRTVTAGLLASLAAACAPRTPPPDQGASLSAADIRPPRFSDAKPHPWQGRSPDSYPVHGIDVSRWQTSIDWPEARRHGVNFAWIKATEGADGTHLNPEFHRQWQGAGQAGLLRGGYHLYYWCGTPEAQARHFIEVVPKEPGTLPPVLDLEWNPYSASCQLRPPAAEIRDIVARYSAVIARHYGQRPVIYMTVDFQTERSDAGWAGYDLWLRSVAAAPELAHGRSDYRFWQYSGTGLIPGIAGRVDLNCFAGSRQDWLAWTAARLIR